MRRHFHGQRSTVFAFSGELDDRVAQRSSEVGQNWLLNRLASLFKRRKLLGETTIALGLLALSFLGGLLILPTHRSANEIAFQERDWCSGPAIFGRLFRAEGVPSNRDKERWVAS